MNLISYILLGIIIAAFLLVGRYVFSGKAKKGCCNGCCEQCGGSSKQCSSFTEQ